MVASMEMMYRAQLDALEESYFNKEGKLKRSSKLAFRYVKAVRKF